MIQKVNIATEEGLFEIEAEPISLYGHQCMVHPELDLFVVSDFKSGLQYNDCADANKENAISKAREVIMSKSSNEILKAIKGQLQFYGIQYPVNQPGSRTGTNHSIVKRQEPSQPLSFENVAQESSEVTEGDQLRIGEVETAG